MASNKKYIFGLILVLIGALLLAETLGVDEIFFELMIPIGLILGGIWLIFRKKAEEHQARHSQAGAGFQQSEQYHFSSERSTAPPGPEPPPRPDQNETAQDRHWHSADSPNTDQTGKLNYSKAFGDMYIDLAGVSMQSVNVSAGMGDVEIKLHNGILSTGLNRLIISSFIGDVRVFVPRDMAVFAHCSSFVGDINVGERRASGFGGSIDSRSPGYDKAENKLYIACSGFIGDIRVVAV